MKVMIALIKREYIEHKAAFVLGPAILLALALVAALYGAISSHQSWQISAQAIPALKFYEAVFAISAYGWSVYLLVMLVFYFSSSFAADSRNNAMLFWKSMPQSDARILTAKVLAALTVFPAAIVLAIAITGLIAYLPALVAGNILTDYAPPNLIDTLSVWAQIIVVAIVYIGIGLLWYLPFLTWVGMLGTLAGRWAIPLAVLIPLVAAFFEFMITGGSGPRGGHILSFLRERLAFDIQGMDPEIRWLMDEPLNAFVMVGQMLEGTDWISLAGGVAVAVIVVFAASEYRRRFILT